MDNDDDNDDYTTTLLLLFNNCNWSELHEDLLELIFKELSTVEDCLRFGCVCVSWRSLLVPHLHPDLLNPQLPLLMIPSLPWPPPQCPPVPPLPITTTTTPNTLQKYKDEEEEAQAQKRSFYNVFDKRVYDDFHINLPYNMVCRGSSYGWIIASGNESNGFCVELFNPFISINNEYQKIQLPPLTAFPYDPDEIYLGDGFHFLEKAILSANPTTTKNYVVMVIYSGWGKLGFWKPGDQVWTDVPMGSKEDGSQSLEDVIYDHNNGVFYSVNYSTEVMVCDLNGCDDHQPAKVTRLAPSPFPCGHGPSKRYIVQSEGNLLMVHRFVTRDDTTKGFLVLKFHEEKNEEAGDKDKLVNNFVSPDWEVINTLPGRMLFVGGNASMSFAASEFPGGKSSCIYFTDDLLSGSSRGYLQIGIFNMEDMTIEMLHPMESNKYMFPANTIWVEPTLKCCLHF